MILFGQDHASHAAQAAATDALHGKTAVVTGSTRGIGRAIAEELARAGADVLVHGRSPRPEADQCCQAIHAVGRESEVVLADLADPALRARFAEQAWGWRSGVDIWVNNAGADVLTGKAAQAPFDTKLASLWAVDVEATIQLSRDIGHRMVQRNRPAGTQVILNMGWDQASWGMSGDSGEMFAAVKGAIMAFSLSLAHSLAPRVRVNCLAPGWVRTAWGQTASKTWQQRACRESLSNRWGTPVDIARVARFLASPAAEFVNGQVVPINGGFRQA